MQKVSLSILLTNLLVFSLLTSNPKGLNEAPPRYAERQVLVKFTAAATEAFFTENCPLTRLEKQHGIIIQKSFAIDPSKKNLSPNKLLEHPTLSTQALIELLKTDPAIQYVEPNYQ